MNELDEDGLTSYIRRPGLSGKMKGIAKKKEAAKKIAKAAPKAVSKVVQPALPVKDMKGNFADGTAPAKEMSTQDTAEMASKGMELAGIGGEGDYSTEGGVASGAASGAAMGAKFGGAHGAVIGGVIGGVAGGLGASAIRKDAAARAKAKYAAKHASNLGRIEQEKDQKIQSALGNMKQAFSKNLNKEEKVKL